jgi:ABC-type polysaccharide/polyol phosphate export permease
LGAGFHFLLGFGIALVFVWYVNGFGNLPALLTLIPTFALLFVIGWSLAACIGVLNVMFQDAQHIIEVLLQIMFYVTPIMYPPSMLLKKLEIMNLTWVMNLNPFAVLLELIRQPLLFGQIPSLTLTLLGAFIGFMAVGIASLALLRFEKRLIFYL